MQGTRKKGCEAHIQIVEFKTYPKFSMKWMMSPELSQKRIRIIHEDRLNSLREIFFDEGLQVERRYFVKLPTEEAHHKCHPTKGVIGLSQRVHPELIAKIQELVSFGTVEPVEIKWLLKHHTKYYMMCANNMPDPNDRAYFPTLDDINIHIARAKRVLQLSVVDQENAEKLIKKQQELSSESCYHFRPYQLKNPENFSKTKLSRLEAADFETTLLWVHQEAWQQELMLKYGNVVCLMDATYKTTRYDLPLFFICVHTNAGYCVIAEFCTIGVYNACIEEALRVLTSWNPSWKPKYFMTDYSETDYSEAEIAALETSFPGVTVYLCDFHHEQAWERWIRDSKHGLSSGDAEWLLDHLRACAWTPSATSDENQPVDHHYQQAVSVLKSSNAWKIIDLFLSGFS